LGTYGHALTSQEGHRANSTVPGSNRSSNKPDHLGNISAAIEQRD
jgi:hypothetical protein